MFLIKNGGSIKFVRPSEYTKVKDAEWIADLVRHGFVSLL